jgi:hypothetical protein
VRHLHLLKKIDSHGVFVAFARQEDLNEVRNHAQLDELARIALLVHGQCWIRLAGRLATG